MCARNRYAAHTDCGFPTSLRMPFCCSICGTDLPRAVCPVAETSTISQRNPKRTLCAPQDSRPSVAKQAAAATKAAWEHGSRRRETRGLSSWYSHRKTMRPLPGLTTTTGQETPIVGGRVPADRTGLPSHQLPHRFRGEPAGLAFGNAILR